MGGCRKTSVPFVQLPPKVKIAGVQRLGFSWYRIKFDRPVSSVIATSQTDIRFVSDAHGLDGNSEILGFSGSSVDFLLLWDDYHRVVVFEDTGYVRFPYGSLKVNYGLSF